MKTEGYALIDDPTKHDPQVLLDAFEHSQECFTIGRRNDDVVNWFLAKRYEEITAAIAAELAGCDPRPLKAYIADFVLLKAKLRPMQTADLKVWSRMSPQRKIEQCYRHYAGIELPDTLKWYWIPQTYWIVEEVPTTNSTGKE